METIAAGLFGGEARPVIHHALARRQDAAGILARLFAFADVVDEPAVHAVLGEVVTHALLDAGILVHDAGALRCTFKLGRSKACGCWLTSQALAVTRSCPPRVRPAN